MQTQRHVWTSATYSYWCLKNFAPFTANDRAKWHFDWKTFSNSLVYNVYTNHIANRMSNYYFHYKVIKSRVRTCWFCAHTHSARARLFRNAERPGLIVLRFGVDWNSLSLTHCLSISLPCSPVVAYPFLFSSSFIYSPSLFPPLSSPPLATHFQSRSIPRTLCVFFIFFHMIVAGAHTSRFCYTKPAGMSHEREKREMVAIGHNSVWEKRTNVYCGLA